MNRTDVSSHRSAVSNHKATQNDMQFIAKYLSRCNLNLDNISYALGISHECLAKLFHFQTTGNDCLYLDDITALALTQNRNLAQNKKTPLPFVNIELYRSKFDSPISNNTDITNLESLFDGIARSQNQSEQKPSILIATLDNCLASSFTQWVPCVGTRFSHAKISEVRKQIMIRESSLDSELRTFNYRLTARRTTTFNISMISMRDFESTRILIGNTNYDPFTQLVSQCGSISSNGQPLPSLLCERSIETLRDSMTQLKGYFIHSHTRRLESADDITARRKRGEPEEMPQSELTGYCIVQDNVIVELRTTNGDSGSLLKHVCENLFDEGFNDIYLLEHNDNSAHEFFDSCCDHTSTHVPHFIKIENLKATFKFFALKSQNNVKIKESPILIEVDEELYVVKDLAKGLQNVNDSDLDEERDKKRIVRCDSKSLTALIFGQVTYSHEGSGEHVLRYNQEKLKLSFGSKKVMDEMARIFPKKPVHIPYWGIRSQLPSL